MPERRVVPGDTLNGALRGAALELSHGLEPTPVRQKTEPRAPAPWQWRTNRPAKLRAHPRTC